MTELIRYHSTLSKQEQKALEKRYMKFLKDNWHWLPPPHHILTGNNHGMGVKPPDVWCISVSAEDHRLIHDGKISLDWQLEKLKFFNDMFMMEEGC